MDSARDQIQNMGRSKGDEVSALLAKFNKEKSELEASLMEKQALIDEFLKQIEDQQGEVDHLRQVSLFARLKRIRLTQLVGKRRRDCCVAGWYG